VEALTKQNGVRLLGKLKKKFKKKVKTDPTLPKFLQVEIGNPHIFFGPSDSSLETSKFSLHFSGSYISLNP
jgi:hypothetical protein